MKKHTKIYLDAMGYDTSDFIPCEICGAKAVDIHHIDNKKSGGSKSKDYIENLMALCRADHVKYGDKKQHKQWLKEIHERAMMNASHSH